MRCDGSPRPIPSSGWRLGRTNVYALVVIGAGPAGQVGAELASASGRRVLIVDRNPPGGVVTTTGAHRPRRLALTPRGAIAGHGGLLKLIFRDDDRKLLG